MKQGQRYNPTQVLERLLRLVNGETVPRSQLRPLIAALGGTEELGEYMSEIAPDLETFVAPLRDNLGALCAGRKWSAQGRGPRSRGNEGVEGIERISWIEHGRVVSRYEGDSYPEVFLWLADDFVIAHWARIGRCARDDCGRFFVRANTKLTQQRYCLTRRPRCGEVDRMKRWRASKRRLQQAEQESQEDQSDARRPTRG